MRTRRFGFSSRLCYPVVGRTSRLRVYSHFEQVISRLRGHIINRKTVLSSHRSVSESTSERASTIRALRASGYRRAEERIICATLRKQSASSAPQGLAGSESRLSSSPAHGCRSLAPVSTHACALSGIQILREKRKSHLHSQSDRPRCARRIHVRD